MRLSLACATLLLGAITSAPRALPAHDSVTGEEHPEYDRRARPPEILLAQADAAPGRVRVGDRLVRTNRPAQAAAFDAFSPRVKVRWDDRSLFIESDGLPAHLMMVGITAWQQQVPLPQNYRGANAWQIPLSPVPASEPISIKGRFLRGAIAIAANGVPIFNPQNNRGEISAEIGELDQWGGHCGRADDYHYHAAPLHLQSVLGKALPIAYALDGYPIYGLTEPDGSAPAELDSYHGHTTAALGYHYHASHQYPYVNGGFHGQVVERGGQVDPQPRAQSVRRGQEPLRGAKITGFETLGASSYKLVYEVNGDERAIRYSVNADGSVPFEFQNGKGGSSTETYTRREAGPGQDAPPAPRDERGGPPPESRASDGGRPAEKASLIGMDELKKPSAGFVLSSPEVSDGGNLPIDYTGDGSGATLPLEWRGPPSGTQSYALVMDHLAPGNVVKSYWTMWDIPAGTSSLAKNVRGVGKVGTGFKGAQGYEPPHSQGPGPKTYVLTVYALSEAPQIAQAPQEVSRDVLLAAIRGKVLASASLRVVYTRGGSR